LWRSPCPFQFPAAQSFPEGRPVRCGNTREPDFFWCHAVIANGEKIKARRLVGRTNAVNSVESCRASSGTSPCHPRQNPFRIRLRRRAMADKWAESQRRSPDVVEVEYFRRQFFRHGVGPVRREPVLLRVQAGRGVQSAIGHAKDVASAFAIVWSKGRGVNGVRTRSVLPPSANSKYGCGVPGGISPWPMRVGVPAIFWPARWDQSEPSNGAKSIPLPAADFGAAHEKTQPAGRASASETFSSKLPMASKLGHGPVLHGFSNASVPKRAVSRRCPRDR